MESVVFRVQQSQAQSVSVRRQMKEAGVSVLKRIFFFMLHHRLVRRPLLDSSRVQRSCDIPPWRPPSLEVCLSMPSLTFCHSCCLH
jgi:hypothetical protein